MENHELKFWHPRIQVLCTKNVCYASFGCDHFVCAWKLLADAAQLFECNAVMVDSDLTVDSDSTKIAIYSCITLARFMSFSGGIKCAKRWLFEIISLVIIGLSCISYLKTFIGITGTEFQCEEM